MGKLRTALFAAPSQCSQGGTEDFSSCFIVATIFKLKSQISVNRTLFLAEDGRERPHGCKHTRVSSLPPPWACRLPLLPSAKFRAGAAWQSSWSHSKAPP